MAFCIKQKNRARFALETNKFCTFRVMDHNFGSVRRVSWQRKRAETYRSIPNDQPMMTYIVSSCSRTSL